MIAGRNLILTVNSLDNVVVVNDPCIFCQYKVNVATIKMSIHMQNILEAKTIFAFSTGFLPIIMVISWYSWITS